MSRVEDEHVILESLPVAGPSEWTSEQLRTWANLSIVAHSEYGKAAVLRALELHDGLAQRLAEAEGEGCTLHKDAPHGKEAEELRRGIERLLSKPPEDWRRALHGLLDRVDARDSLAHVRANQEHRETSSQLRKVARAAQRAGDVLLEGLVDGLDSGSCSTRVLRRALVALGAKARDLPQDIPPAGAVRRGR